MILRTSRVGLALIEAFESFRAKPYKCPAGVWTIGFGHTTAAGGLKVDAHTPAMTKSAAEELLRRDIDAFEDELEKLVSSVQLENYQFDALVSFAFNVGMGGLKSSTLLKKVLRSDFDGAALEFAKWDKATVEGKKVALPGLTRRRSAEACLFRGDLDEAERYTGVDFGDMPQKVEPPAPPKTMSQSKTGNATIVGGVTSVAAIGKGAFDEIQGHVNTAKQLADQAKQITTTTKTTVESASGTVTQVRQGFATVQTLVPHQSPMDTVAHLAPWLLMLVILIAAFSFIYYDRRKKLHEEGV